MNRQDRRGRMVIALLVGIAALLMCCLRLLFLESDPYPRLSWSTGLLTDEGYYIHNARNLALFGYAKTDEFNNALLMPTLHLIQVVVFDIFGVGAVQARLISVVMSLLALAIFWDALRRAFGIQAAGIATLFLGLDHIYLLYNRMALMDTPATLALIGAFWFFVRGLKQEESVSETGTEARVPKTLRLSSRVWSLMLCGILFVAAYATRGLCAILFPVPLLALWRKKTDYRTFWFLTRNLIIGFSGACLFYLIVWYLPNHEEMARTSRYYISQQLLPHSLAQWGGNVYLNTLGGARGMASFLFRHTPVLFSLCCFWFAGWGAGKFSASYAHTLSAKPPAIYENAAARFLMWWLFLLGLFLTCVNYNPSRYYVLFMPPLAAISALALFQRTEIGNHLRSARLVNFLTALFLTYHLFNVALPYFLAWQGVILFFAATLSSLLTVICCRAILGRFIPLRFSQGIPPRAVLLIPIIVWASVNGYWLTDWLSGLSYRQRDADRWLAQNLPENSVLIGDVAPGLCLNNRFRAICVIPKLYNDKYPVERFAGSPRYILILDINKWKEKWWEEHYPSLMEPKQRLHVFSGLLRSQFYIAVYEVPQEFGLSGMIMENNISKKPKL